MTGVPRLGLGHDAKGVDGVPIDRSPAAAKGILRRRFRILQKQREQADVGGSGREGKVRCVGVGWFPKCAAAPWPFRDCLHNEGLGQKCISHQCCEPGVYFIAFEPTRTLRSPSTSIVTFLCLEGIFPGRKPFPWIGPKEQGEGDLC